MSLNLKYPINNTKVSNSRITFQWEKIIGKERYELVIFRLVKRPSLHWEKTFSDSFSGSSHRKVLNPNNVYHCILVANDDPELPLRFIYPSFGGGVPNTEQVPKLHPDISHLEHTSSSFYVKKHVNYLEKYLNSHFKPLKPTIPLLFYSLNRYYRWKLNPSNIKLTPFEENFFKTIDNLPDEMKSLDKLNELLRNYNNSNLDSVKLQLFGPIFDKFPNDTDAETWINKAINRLFSGTWLDEVKSAGQQKKRMNLVFKYPRLFSVKDVLLHGELYIPVDPKYIGSGSKPLNIDETYLLRITPKNGSPVTIPLRLIKKEEEYFLHSTSNNMNSFDAASFKAQLLKKNFNNSELWWDDGNLSIKGGIPIILSIEPDSVAEGSSKGIKIKVRDGGTGMRVKLQQGDQVYYEIPSNQDPRLVRSNQTLNYQEFTFKLTDCSHPIYANTYDFIFQNTEEVDSVNSITFAVNGFEYKVLITKLECVDESDPEWFGNDSISFQTTINTDRFLQTPTSSTVYHGFHDGKRIARFKNDDNYIYPNSNWPGGRRIIEGELSISIRICEHDDLDWLTTLMNAIIDQIQSFLANLVNVYTFGMGGYIISAGLEVSGLNDMREEAIDSMVSGWEVEVLHKGKTSLLPNTNDTYVWDKTLTTDESKYKIYFKADRIVQA